MLQDAALLGAPETAVLCDVSAAHRWDLPLPLWLAPELGGQPVGVAVQRGLDRQRRRGVRGRRLTLPPEHLTIYRGQSLTTPARTWLDCAELLPPEHLVAVGDVILRRRLAEVVDLEAMIRWGRGRRGVTTARLVLPLLDAAAESPQESITRYHLMAGRLPRPVCNLDIIVAGEWLARADLAWPAQRVIVEYDGADHLDERRRRSDAARRNLLQDRGWRVIVFTASDLRHPHAMVALVRSALESRSAP